MKQLETIRNKIKEPNPLMMQKVKERWDTLCKPIGSLGRLEEMVGRFGGIYNSVKMPKIKSAVIVMGADNGVVAEGVTQTGQEVTRQVIENMTRAGSTVCIMAKRCQADVFPVDIGINGEISCEGVMDAKIAYGTANIAKGPAMTPEEAIAAIEIGIRIIEEKKAEGYNLFATGEMGIGNTTTSSAVCSVLLKQPPALVTGRGAGLTKEALSHKIDIISQAIARNSPDPLNTFDVLTKLGGLDLAGMAGLCIGAAISRVPIFLDGFISAVAALAAVRMVPECRPYLFASHCSAEPAGKMVLEALEMEPYIYADMCLGEGTGAVIGMELAGYAVDCYSSIPSFQENGIEEYITLV